MARPIWTNAAGDFSWATAGNWSTGSVPVNGDDVYFDGTYTSDSVNDGLGQSAVALTSLNTRRTYRGELGSEGSYLQISATLVQHRGGTLHLDSGTTDTAKVVIDTDSRLVNRLDGDIAILNALKGRIYLGSSYAGSVSGTSIVNIAYRDNPTSDVYISTPFAGALAGIVNQVAGQLHGNIGNAASIAQIAGGRYVLGPNTATSGPAGLNVSGGRVEWYFNNGLSILARLLGGTLDLSLHKIESTMQAVGQLRLWPAATLLPYDGFAATTFYDFRHEQEVC